MKYIIKIDSGWLSKLFIQIKSIDYEVVEGFLTVLIVFFFVGFLKIKIASYQHYETKISNYRIENLILKSTEATNFLMKSGKTRLYENKVRAAYKEYILAYRIAPNNIKVNQVLIETLSILCKNDNRYCDELDNVMYASVKN